MNRTGRKGNNREPDNLPPRATARPRSVQAQYASVFVSKQDKRNARVLEAADHDYSRCPVCEEIPDEAHLHGATLYQAGAALF